MNVLTNQKLLTIKEIKLKQFFFNPKQNYRLSHSSSDRVADEEADQEEGDEDQTVEVSHREAEIEKKLECFYNVKQIDVVNQNNIA